jgi:hypothetical protein
LEAVAVLFCLRVGDIVKNRIHLLAGSISIAALSTVASAAPTWSLLYSQSGTSTATNSLRGLALSTTGSDLYGGFVKSTNTAGYLRMPLGGPLPVSGTNFYNITTASNGSSSADHQGEVVATDDRGLVYGASIKDSTSVDNARIFVLDSSLNSGVGTFTKKVLADISLPGITGETVGGMDVRKVGASTYQLYVTRFHSGSGWIERYNIGGTGANDATLTLDNTFDGDGQFDLSTAIGGTNSLRGIDVAPDGTLFVASRENDALYKISSNLSSVVGVSLDNAMDVALYNGKAYVTQYLANNSNIIELDQASLLQTDSFTATGTFPHPELADSGYSAIDIDASGRIYLSDQLYVGSGGVRSDRVLISSPVPEPTSLAVLALASLALGRRRRAVANKPHVVA